MQTDSELRSQKSSKPAIYDFSVKLDFFLVWHFLLFGTTATRHCTDLNDASKVFACPQSTSDDQNIHTLGGGHLTSFPSQKKITKAKAGS